MPERSAPWRKLEADPGLVRDLAERYDIDLITASILVRRKLTDPAEIRFLLDRDVRLTWNPFRLPGMEDAVERTLAAIGEGEKVLVFGDRDADGITATSILVDTLRSRGVPVSWRVPMGDDSYGLTMDAVEEHAAADGTLIITVDCGISNRNEVARAAELGVDVVILDHHNPPEVLPDAVAIVDPKLADSLYPFPGICGVTIAAKFALALAIAGSSFYGQPVCLLNARPGNDSVVVEAVRLHNLVPVDRIRETVVPGVVPLDRSPVIRFLEGQQILVYDAQAQARMLAEAFGSGVQFGTLDLAPEVWRVFPALQGKSLLRMRTGSRLARYAPEPPDEIDVLETLFSAFANEQLSEAWSGFERNLDLVALGTIADMMPLTNENRVMVERGLTVCSSTTRPGLAALLARQNLYGSRLSARDIGWSLTPMINATGRMGKPDIAVRLLLSDNPEEARELAAEVDQLNRERKQAGERAWDDLLPKAEAARDRTGGKLIVVQSKRILRGITGIIAGRLMRRFGIPAIVIAELEDVAVGSVRSGEQLHVTDFLARFSDILTTFGGHESAGGFSLPSESLPALAEALYQAALTLDTGEDEAEELLIDAEIPLDHLTPDLLKIVDRFGPYGMEHAPLRLLARGLRIEQVDFMGKPQAKHVRLLLAGGRHKWPAVFWNAASLAGEVLKVGAMVDAAFELTRDQYNNQERTRLVIHDLQPS